MEGKNKFWGGMGEGKTGFFGSGGASGGVGMGVCVSKDLFPPTVAKVTSLSKALTDF